MSMHAEDWKALWKDHPVAAVAIATAIVTGLVAAVFWNVVLR